MKKIILSIDGMTCSACSNGLEKYLNKQNGVYNATVNLVMANATIEYDEKILTLSKLEEFVKKAGFKSLSNQMLENHLYTCISRDLKDGKLETLDEVISIFKRFNRG